jgi:cell division septation protein DedD
LLPVPNPDAPIGNVGSASIVYRTQQSNASAALKLPYRVVVEANDSQQAQLRAAFPNAFRTSIKGRSLMQVGAFGDRGKAEQLMQTLSSQGVQAMVETVE